MDGASEQLLREVVESVQRSLPDRFRVQVVMRSYGSNPPQPWMTIDEEARGSSLGFLVELMEPSSPAEVRRVFGSSLARSLRAAGSRDVIVVSRYLSARTKELLREEGVSYADLAGNAMLDQGGMYIVAEGEERSMAGRTATLRGAKVGQIVRALVDGRPPASGQDIARAAQVTEGYVSRVLDALAAEALIERHQRGPVYEVDWPALLRQRALTQTLLKKQSTTFWISPTGPAGLLDLLRERTSTDRTPGDQWMLTGSHAARRIAPVAAPGIAVLYSMSPTALAADLGLIPADSGADVAIVRPDNEGVFRRPMQAWPPTVGLSQLVIDCLSGPGRMPAEGEAVLQWMQENEGSWREPSVRALWDAAP